MVSYRSSGLDTVFHALGHPARRAMLERLSEGERNLTELASPFKMSFPAASKHVRVLERAKLVRRRKVGRAHICRINPAPLKEVADWAQAYRALWEERFDRLDAYLEDLQGKERPRDRQRAKK